jgi:hypothetical protein
MAALVVGAGISVVPLEVAGAQPPSTAVLVPSNNVTVSGTSVILDASASSGVTQVEFEVTGGILSDSVIATATLTYYGWIASWNSNTVSNGTYSLQSVATSGGSTVTSSGISITVGNAAPDVSIVLPSAGLTGSQELEATASLGVSQVYFEVQYNTVHQCPITGPGGNGSFCRIGQATDTNAGWQYDWNTNSIPSGNFLLFAVASYPNGDANFAVAQIFVENPGPSVVVPNNGSTVSGSQYLDCATPPAPGFSFVQFWTGSTLLGNASPTIYGWLYKWNTTSVANGTYSIFCSAAYPEGGSGQGAGISVTVAN